MPPHVSAPTFARSFADDEMSRSRLLAAAKVVAPQSDRADGVGAGAGRKVPVEGDRAGRAGAADGRGRGNRRRSAASGKPSRIGHAEFAGADGGGARVSATGGQIQRAEARFRNRAGSARLADRTRSECRPGRLIERGVAAQRDRSGGQRCAGGSGQGQRIGPNRQGSNRRMKRIAHVDRRIGGDDEIVPIGLRAGKGRAGSGQDRIRNGRDRATRGSVLNQQAVASTSLVKADANW